MLHLASLERMRAGAFSIYGISNIHEWVCKFTRINGKPFNFIEREFQLAILQDTAKEQIVVKAAQTGLSELSYRYAVALCCIRQNTNVIYTFPTASDATKNNQTRIDPMIEGSPELTRLVSKDLNNSEIKKFGENSFLFFKGTMAETAALSTPADAVISDEYDKSNMDIVTTYTSRMQDRELKIRRIFSTPTIAGHGVHKEAQTANRLKHFVKCRRCSHTFLPDYYEHVKIPGYDGPLEEITKHNLHKVRWQEAYLSCPKCGLDPDMHYTRMPWVKENSHENHYANAWFVSPFSAHRRILVPNLVKDSTSYKKISEFKNQALGIVAEEKNEAITVEDIDKMQEHSFPASSELHQMGIDLGLTCTITIGRQLETGELLIQHRERVHYSRLEVRRAELMREYRVTVCVSDSQPYTDMVNRMCSSHENTWGALYVTSKSPVTFTPKEQDEQPEDGKMGFRIVNINRNAMFDEILALVKAGMIVVNKTDENDIFEKQMLCMKRVEKFTTLGELQYVWVKTGDEEDHYHHSLLYLNTAIQMRHTAGMAGLLGAGIQILRVHRAGKKLHRGQVGSGWD